jgi:phosphoglycerate dehydrogenase-like enzyme
MRSGMTLCTSLEPSVSESVPATIGQIPVQDLLISTEAIGRINELTSQFWADRSMIADQFVDKFSDIIQAPHVAWYSKEAELQLRRSSIEEILRVFRGQPPKNPV